jgi:chromosome segregation ATPase
MIIITDQECEAVPGSGISERVIFPDQRGTLQIMYAALLRLEQVEAHCEATMRKQANSASALVASVRQTAAQTARESVELELEVLRKDIDAERHTNERMTIRIAELDQYREDAAELLREIRDGEVNPEDEADNFLRDETWSELSKARARIAELEVENEKLKAELYDLRCQIGVIASDNASAVWREREVKKENKSLSEQLTEARSMNKSMLLAKDDIERELRKELSAAREDVINLAEQSSATESRNEYLLEQLRTARAEERSSIAKVLDKMGMMVSRDTVLALGDAEPQKGEGE